MQCLYCKIPLAPLRALNDSQFCSDDHELKHAVDSLDAECLFLYPEPAPAAPGPLEATLEPVEFQPTLADPAVSPRSSILSEPGPVLDLKVLNLLPQAVASAGETLCLQPARESRAPDLPVFGGKVATAAPAIQERWLRMPMPARRLTLALVPVVLAAVSSSFLKPAPGTPNRPFALLSHPLEQVRDTIRSRAALNLTEDFHAGLNRWASRTNARKSWTQDAKGFVRPGVLAVYRPTLGLKNYSFEIVTQLEQRALGAAYRVQDWDHYYALRLRLSKPSPGTRIELVRYSVVNGREAGHVAKSLAVQASNVSAHHIRLEAQESDFTLFWDGKIVDEWSDARYPDGGVGLFSGNGERAQVLWLEVSKQHDLLGRFCALLSPDGYKANERE